MVYPAFPQTGKVPAFLDPFDWFYMLESTSILVNPTMSPNDLNAGFAPQQSGGAVIDAAPWALTGVQPPCPMWAIFGWAYIGIKQAGNNVTPLIAHPQRVGPRFAWIVADGGGNQILT